MKKLILCLAPFLVVACSTPQQQSTVPLDMKAVQEYQQRITSGNTVDKNTPSNNEPLNQSDHKPKVVYQRVPTAIYPSVGVGYGWGHRHHHYGLGTRLGTGYWY